MGALRDTIRTQSFEILRRWLADAQRSPAARGLTDGELVRGLPAQLEAIAVIADGKDTEHLLAPLVEMHVEDRLRQGYELADVIYEYALLERCVCQPPWAVGTPDPEELHRVHRALQKVPQIAVRRFTDYLWDEEQLEKRHVSQLCRIAGAPDGDTTLGDRQRALLDEVRLAVDAELLLAFQLDDHRQLVFEAAVGEGSDDPGVRALATSPLLARALQAERATELDPAQLGPTRLAESSVVLGQPLRTGDRLLGVLVAALPDRTRLPARARRFSALAERLSPLWENARLYELTRRDLFQLREERQLRDWFVSMLAHDLRGPLSAAQVNAELILHHAPDEPGKSDPKLRRLVAKVVRGLCATDDLIRDLLDVHRVRAGQKLPLKLQPCDLADVAEDVQEELSATHAGRLRLELDRDLRGVFCPVEVQRMLWNLVTNAVKYGEPDHPVLMRLRRQTGGVEVTVHNQGTPIARDELSTVFEPYQRTRHGETRSVGWGLGLALVKACAEAHGGTVSVDSSEERGTTFTVFLPSAAKAARSSSSSSQSPSSADQAAS
jgi:signal transduction histidine kinase